jgi:hypothetical protein
MLRLLALAAVLAAAVPAHADDCDPTDPAGGTWTSYIAAGIAACEADPACATSGRMPSNVPPRGAHGRFATLDATLAATSEARAASHAADATAGGELVAHGAAGWRGGLQLCARTDLVAGRESRGDTAVQVAFPMMFSGISIGGEQEWQLRPALDAPRVWLRRAYTVDEVHAGVAMILWARAGGGTATVFPMRMTDESHEQDGYRAVFETWRLGAYEQTGPSGTLEVLPWTHEAMYPRGVGTDAAPAEPSSWLDRVDLFDVVHQSGDVTFELALGGVWASSQLKCRACAPVVATAAVSWRAAGATWSARAERSAQLAMDDTVTVEDRVTGGVVLPEQGFALRATAFAALTRTTDAPALQLTGGGAVGVDVVLPEKVQLAVDASLARSYYGRLDGAPAPAPELAGLGTVKLERTFVVLPPRG